MLIYNDSGRGLKAIVPPFAQRSRHANDSITGQMTVRSPQPSSANRKGYCGNSQLSRSYPTQWLPRTNYAEIRAKRASAH